ncbi:YesL family protein [Lachnospiraceae bacterium OttesenSCG-928-D06]|nr:YesL family protein [Lachnospiraceae bacterium OttesenSCG-928-D06]
MKLFNLDSPLMQFLNKVADLLWLNILTIICCIPIVTIGASYTALHYMCLKMVRNEETYITKGYFKSFKENFKQSTGIWMLMLLVIGVVVGDIYIMNYSGMVFPQWLKIVIFAVAILVLITCVFIFPVQARFENKVSRTIKNAFIMSILQFPKAILMVILLLLPVILFLVSTELIPIAFLFGISVPAYLSAMLYNKFFQKLEDQMTEAAENGENTEVSSEEDERIFKDELDESLVSDNKDYK